MSTLITSDTTAAPYDALAPFLPIVGRVAAALPHRFSVAQVEAAIRAGVLTEQDRCELIRGELIEKMVIGDPHMAAVKRLNQWFSRRAGERYQVGVQDAIKLADSRPEPDLTLLVTAADWYESRTPAPADVLLVIEVADSSLEFDRTVKGPLYTENGIREYWVVNLIDQCLEVSRQPRSAGGYGENRVLRRGESVSPLLLPDVLLAVEDVLSR
jgi:Uma2 family endonuclease